MKHVRITKKTARPNGKGYFKKGAKMECLDVLADELIKNGQAVEIGEKIKTVEEAAEEEINKIENEN